MADADMSLRNNAMQRALGETRVCRGLDARSLRVKRRFDLLVASSFLVFMLPVILLIALLIKLTTPGPVLLCERRVGLHNRIFKQYKFRTVRADPADQRLTRLGHVLQRLSLDELPQLFNVIAGEMSLVGPQPHAPATQADGRLFAEATRDYAERHAMRPGITGWAQINGCRGETRTRQQMIQRLEFDLHYIKHWSIWLDLAIIWGTIMNVMFDDRAS